MSDPVDRGDRARDAGAARRIAADSSASVGREIFLAGSALLLVCAGLFLVWQTTSSLLLVFAGVLLATFFDSVTRMVGLVLPIGRPWRLALVLIVLARNHGPGAEMGSGRIA